MGDMRRIDWEAPLSEDDELWLVNSGIPGIAERIAVNRDQFAGVVEGEEDEGDNSPPLDPQEPADEDDDYDEWTVSELTDEMSKRSLTIVPKSKKADLIASLREYDAAQADGKE